MSEIITVGVPDIGDFKDVEIIEVLVGVGDEVAPEDPLITLESDKASIEIPAPQGGVVRKLKVKVGDRVSEGDAILDMEAVAASGETKRNRKRPWTAAARRRKSSRRRAHPNRHPGPRHRGGAEPASRPAPAEGPRPSPTAHIADEKAFRKAHASPGIRRFARELGVDLAKVDGSGRKKRILREDVQGFVKRALSHGRGIGAGRRTDARDRLQPVRADRNPGADQDQQADGQEPAPQLGDRAARDPVRRGGYHRARGLPQVAEGRVREEGGQGHLPAVPDEGRGVRPEAVSALQCLAGRDRGEPDHQEVLQPRGGGRYTPTVWWCRWCATSTARVWSTWPRS
jgi:pyruvate/2-oxoglutarate dehydrogenase complex dihydrolipoamide acyltransferase (E2) component